MPRGGKRTGSGRKAIPKKPDALEALSLRKRLYLEGRAEGKSKMQAALDAGYSETMAANAKARIETKDVRDAFSELIQAVIPAEKIVARIAEGLNATETKLYAFQGMIFDREDLIAWTERREYARLAAEFGRYFVPTQKTEGEVTHTGDVTVTVEFIGNAAAGS